MKAVVVHLKEQSSARSTSIAFEEKPRPKPEPSQVLIKVSASPLQPSDFVNSQGQFPSTTFPRVPGRDFAGTVVEPVDSRLYGQNVVGTSGPVISFTRDGAHAEYVIADEIAVVEIPDDLDIKRVGLLGTPWTTAHLALTRAFAKPGENVLVLGAGGQVGSAVSQLAKSSLFGCRVLTAGHGSRYDIDVASSPDLAAIKDLTTGKGPDVVVDTTGDLALQAAALKQLANGGRLSGRNSWTACATQH